MIERGDNLLVDRTCQNHLHNFDSLGIRHPQAPGEPAFNVQPFQHGRNLRPAAMHNNRIDARLLEQYNIARKLACQLCIAHGVAAIFDDHGFAVIALHEGQGLRQNMGLCYPVIRRCRFFCPVFYFGF